MGTGWHTGELALPLRLLPEVPSSAAAWLSQDGAVLLCAGRGAGQRHPCVVRRVSCEGFLHCAQCSLLGQAAVVHRAEAGAHRVAGVLQRASGRRCWMCVRAAPSSPLRARAGCQHRISARTVPRTAAVRDAHRQHCGNGASSRVGALDRVWYAGLGVPAAQECRDPAGSALCPLAACERVPALTPLHLYSRRKMQWQRSQAMPHLRSRFIRCVPPRSAREQWRGCMGVIVLYICALAEGSVVAHAFTGGAMPISARIPLAPLLRCGKRAAQAWVTQLRSRHQPSSGHCGGHIAVAILRRRPQARVALRERRDTLSVLL